MIKDILYKSDILDGLFTQKDFEFLQGTNNRQEEIEFEIKMADLKRDKIIEYINSIDINENNIRNSDTIKLKNNIDSAQEAFGSINSVIRNLTSLLDEFNEIEKDILEVVVKKDSRKTSTKDRVKIINKQISEFKARQLDIHNENIKLNLKISKFLDEIENGEILEPKKEIEEINVKNSYKNLYNNIIDEHIKDNLLLRVSERNKKVYLPYTKTEIKEFLDNYPEEYSTPQDVIEQEFITDISSYNKHPVFARFREAYSLSRNKEMKSAIDSLKFAMDIMFKRELNPTIIAAVKSQKQLEDYMECLEKNTLDKFKGFEIIFEVSPI